MPDVGTQEGFDGHAAHVVARRQFGTDPAGPVWLLVEGLLGVGLRLAAGEVLLVDQLRLRFDRPVGAQADREATFDRQGQRMPVAIQTLAVFAAAVDVETGAHGHRIHMPALIVGHAPVHTQAFTFEADVGFPVADQGFAHTVEATVQAAVPHEKTGTVSIAAAGFTDKQVRADLQALVVQFQARGRRCTVSDGGRKERGPLACDRVGG
ncbi:hypothetical protein D3C75_882660 [compost metagenome]